jgi:hypothetical protein
MTRTALLLAALALLGCAKDKPKGEGKKDPAPAAGAEPLRAFHEVLAPIWHAEEGPQKITDACDAAERMIARAGDLVGAPPPAGAQGNEEAWRTTTKSLVNAAQGLKTACAADGRPAVPEALRAVHEAYHMLVKIRGPKNE